MRYTLVKPHDHPEFFRLPPPDGRSRESTIVLDADGRFFHDGELFKRDTMKIAFSSWIQRHPEDGRYILNNGYDWTYFRVEDTPFFVLGVRIKEDGSGAEPCLVEPCLVELCLSDGTTELLCPETLSVSEEGKLYCRVKQGAFEAAFLRSATFQVSSLFSEDADGNIVLSLSDQIVPLRRREAKA